MSEPRCDDDFFCGQCEDCLTGEHPENRERGVPMTSPSEDVAAIYRSTEADQAEVGET